ncbi:hypothetical protein ACFL6M_07465 [Candidatus Eisenbacteria bacterium]|uniref:Uncharacterized protein n=1 Tax=Eiseniibacteriota bacterium TaxID=2212470 RepID=A0ABV6YM61_UNCEI
MERVSDILYMVLGLVLLAPISVGIGCSSSAECEVIYDGDSDLCMVLLNPPEETGKSNQEGTMQRSTSMSREPGGPLIKVATYTVTLTRTFEESGNVYTITGDIHMDKQDDSAKITEYDLTVTGGVYGDSPRHYIKEK